jgi:hypothetical protein
LALLVLSICQAVVGCAGSPEPGTALPDGGGSAPLDISYGQDLARWVGRDVRQLTPGELASFQAEVKVKTGVQLGDKLGPSVWSPWLVAACVEPDAAWVLVEAYPGYAVPDASGMKVHFFDRAWAHQGSQTLPTGYRLDLAEVTIQRRPELDCPLLVAKVTPSGPLTRAFEPGDFQLEYFARLETALCMVRLEDNTGSLVRNSYRWSAPMKGPSVPTQTKEQWIACLTSSNAVTQLSALVWLTGTHLSSNEERKPDVTQESVADSRMFESVRDDPRTAVILNGLKSDKNHWVQDYAKLGIVEISRQ